MIPIYKAIISSDNEGLFKISLVDEPAVLTQWQAFNEAEKPVMVKLEVEDEDQHIISGVIMRCNFPIYRFSKDLGEYYIVYDKETIQLMAEKMLADNTQNCINQMHTEGTDTTSVKMLQVFVKDVENGINPSGFEDVEDGSLFASFKVYDEDIWAKIKEGEYNGFSLEGYFSLIETGIELKKQNNKTNKRINTMSKLKEALKSLLQEFGSITTDKGTLEYEGSLEVGTEVSINGEIAEDGEYKTDEKIIVVGEGKVTEIRDVEVIEEEVPTEEKSLFRRMIEKYAAEETYQEKEQKIIDAIKALGVEYPYLMEASDEYAIICTWNESGEKYFKYDISWDEDGNAIIGGMTEVESAFVPVEENAPVEETPVVEETMSEETPENTEDERDLASEIDALKAEVDALKELIKDIVKEPAQDPIVEEFEVIKKETKTGNAKLDKAISRFSKLK